MYDEKYLLKMLKKNSPTASVINAIRWEIILRYCSDVNTVLDYGCGCNFLTVFAPEGVDVDSFDIGDYNGYRYPQTGIRRDSYDVICLFDVIEHVDWGHEPDVLMIQMIQSARYAVIAIPVFKEGVFEQWRHYKPGEHLTYFTPESLEQLMKSLGFELIHQGTDECPPRLDIGTFVFRRV
jgi:hypothetical protein